MNLTDFSVTARKAAQWDRIEKDLELLEETPEIMIINNRRIYKISLASPEDVDRISRSMQKLR